MDDNPASGSDDGETARLLTDDSLYRQMCESMTSGVLLIDAQGRIETLNLAAAAILGLDREAVLGRSFMDVFIVEERFDELNEALLAAIQDGETGHHRVANITVAERTLPLSVSTTYLREPSNDLRSRRGVVAVFSDISEVEELRVSELQLRRDLEARHNELSEAYVRLEQRNNEFGSMARKVQTVRIAAAVFVVALVVTIGGYLWSEPSNDWFGATAADEAEGEVRTVTVEPRRITSTITVASVIKPRRELAVTSLIEGRIDQVHVRHGEAVLAGQPLLTLDIAKERIQRRTAQTAFLKARIRLDQLSNWTDGVEVAKAQRAVNKAQVALEGGRADLEEMKFLIEHGLVPAKKKVDLERRQDTRRLDLEAARQELTAVLAKGPEDLEIARLELAGATEEVERIDQILRNATVFAPVAGVVLRLKRRTLSSVDTLTAGNSVEQGQKLLTIGDIQGIAVTGWVDEADVRRIRIGHAVRISGPAFPGLDLEGKITYVSSEASSGTGQKLPTFEVAAIVDRLEDTQREAIRLGMSADMKIVVYENDKALAVPLEAVDLAENRPRLHIWDDGAGAARPVYVTTGATTTDAVEIRSGIAAGDRVVLP